MLSRKQIFDLWLDALESGKYTQGSGFLYSQSGTFCVLGVLTDIYIKNNPKYDHWSKIGEWHSMPGSRTVCHLPDEIVTFMGFKSNLGKLNEPIEDCWSLAHANDNGISFKQIAHFLRVYGLEVLQIEYKI